MSGQLQPLADLFQIVDANGRPTPYFIQWAQQRQLDIASAITAEQAAQLIIDYLNDHPLQEGIGIGLTNSGKIPAGVQISAKVQEILDSISSTHGTVLFRGAAAWQALAPGTPGHFLKTNGAGADPAWAAGGGGGGSTLFYDTLQVMGQAASGAAFATKGNYFKPLADTTLDSLVAYMTLVSGATYRARCYEVSGKSTTATITAIVDNGVDFVASAAVTLDTVRLRFSSTVNLVAGTTYLLAVSRTDGANNYILPVGVYTGGAGQGFAFPCTVGGERGQIALASPVVGSVTGGYVAGGFFSIGVIGDPGALT